MQFDKLISLGFNCEIAFHLTSINYIESNFFNWTLIKYKALIEILSNDFKELYQFENLKPISNKMVIDTKYSISFHSQMQSELKENKLKFILPEDKLRLVHKTECSKINYFIKKWFNTVNSNESIGYIIKLRCPIDFQNLIKLEQLFKQKYPTHQYKIICIYSKLEGFYPPKDKTLFNNIIFHPVNFFASTSLAWAGDLFSWLAFFQKYHIPYDPSSYTSFYKKRHHDFKSKLSANSNEVVYYLGLSCLYTILNKCDDVILNIKKALELNQHQSIILNVLNDILKNRKLTNNQLTQHVNEIEQLKAQCII